MLFNRKARAQVQQNAGDKIINRIIMLGLIFFLAYSVIKEKKTFEVKKPEIAAKITNLITNKPDDVILVEGGKVSVKISATDLDKLKTLPKLPDGTIEVFSIELKPKIQPVKKLTP